MEQNSLKTQQKNPVAAAMPQARAVPMENEIDLMKLFFALLHSWRAILLAMLIGATLLTAYQSRRIRPAYRATTELYITNSSSLISLQDLEIGTQLAPDYAAIITSRAVLNKVIEDLDLNVDYKALRSMIGVGNPEGTHIIRTSVVTGDVSTSRDIANALLNVSINSIYQIVGTSVPTIIDYSEAEAVDLVMPSLKRYTAIGALAGFLVVAAFVTMKVMMDNTIKSDDDVSKYLQLPVLSAVPYFKD